MKQPQLDIKDILFSGTNGQKLVLFSFNTSDSIEKIVFKFNLWARYFFNKYYSSPDAPFHREIDILNAKVYTGQEDSFLNIIFRGGAKTSRTKLFIAFCILNDISHHRKYIKILSRDNKNSTQFVTDIYNMLVNRRLFSLYPDTFLKTTAKREETMSSFTTAFGVKLLAGSVGTSQRGQLQEDARPDLIVFDDFEDRISLRSAVTTQMIWDNMQEAINGLSKGGGGVYLCNYLSERGNVHKLVERIPEKQRLIIPIEKDGLPTWDRFTIEEIRKIEEKTDDFHGEYMNEPSAGLTIYFDRSVLDRQDLPKVVKEIAGRKLYANYNPSHSYGVGADVAGGLGLDSSADVTIDFSTIPARVVSTYANNLMKPDIYGYELLEQGRRFGECLIGVENNKYDTVIQVLRSNDYPKIYFTEVKAVRAGVPPGTRTYGWNTNGATKYSMLSELKSAVEDGLLQLSDPALIAELRSYTRDDIMDRDEDARLTTRHFDLLISCFVKGTQILTIDGQKPIETIKIGDLVLTRNGYKRVISTMNKKKEVINNIGLTGTPDHPVFYGDNQIKDLSQVSNGDNLYVWDSKLQKIERLSYTQALPIIAIQTPQKEITECISVVEPSGKSHLFTYIDRYGLTISEKYQRAFKYITKMAIHLITLLKTWSVFLLQSICDFICKTLFGKKLLEKNSVEIEKPLLKDSGHIMQVSQSNNWFVSFVKSLLKVQPTMQNIVHGHALKDLTEKKERNHNKTGFVIYVTDNLSRESHTRDAVPLSATPYVDGNTYQQVYNIEVEDTPEYFANGVLVHNCAIAWQMRKFAMVAVSKEGAYVQPEYVSPLISD